MLFDSTLPLRFWSKVYADTSGHWLWTAYRDRDGYGTFYLEPRKRKAHRLAYEDLVGPIPEGKQIDHLCRVRACVNPLLHLEAVTSWQNNHRSPTHYANKAHCPYGHAYDLVNTLYSKGRRYCRICRRRLDRAHKERMRLRRVSS